MNNNRMRLSNIDLVAHSEPREAPPGLRHLKAREVSGFVFFETFYAAGMGVSTHSHEQPNMCIALTGNCREAYGAKVREYKPLTLAYIPAGVGHSLHFPNGASRCFSVDIAPDWLERFRELSKINEDSVHCHGGLLGTLFLKLYKEFHTVDSAATISMEGLTLEMIAEVLRRQAKKNERTPPSWLKRAIELLHARYAETLQLTEIAQAVGVHPVHLAREFRKHYRCTIGEYTRRLRIENACLALSNPELSLSSIGLAAGFADQSHFSRTFKRITGMTPLDYRAKVKAR
ncbi:MAG TPA: AraC family transcriptional regulator [Pyrinomonadaceae bacterium]|nr:AraC family transcriptional regulator [Pyrinomonadaceae bacterium]